MAALDLIKLEEKFIAQLDESKKVQDFLSFAAKHPEVSFDNACLLYFQNPDAPRFVVHKGLANVLEYPTDKPIGLYDLELNEGSPIYKNGIYYSVPTELVMPSATVPLQLNKVFDRIGYTLMPKDDLKVIQDSREYRTLAYPSGWNDEQKNDALLSFFIDYFWECYRQRDVAITITDEQWRRYYRRAIIFMTATLLGYSKVLFPKTFFQFIRDKYQRKSRLSNLFFLFVEVDQILEERHFTMYEAILFRLSQGNPFSDVISINSPDPRDPYISYEAMILRYMDDRIEDTPMDLVHIYPPYRYDRK